MTEGADMTTTFRLAAESDLAAIMAMLADDEIVRTRGDYPTEITPEVRAAFREIESDEASELWVGERGGEVIATLQLTIIPGLSRGGLKRALVEAVRVRADLRGQGIGAALMARVTERARQAGCGMMQLTSDKRRLDAHRFYEKLGYAASHVGMKLKL